MDITSVPAGLLAVQLGHLNVDQTTTPTTTTTTTTTITTTIITIVHPMVIQSSLTAIIVSNIPSATTVLEPPIPADQDSTSTVPPTHVPQPFHRAAMPESFLSKTYVLLD